jgi:Domain of unknown function (DUF4157)
MPYAVPTSEAKTETMQSKSQLAPQPGRAVHPHTLDAVGACSLTGIGSAATVGSPQARRRQLLTGMQSTHGNQAVLRMMQIPQHVTHTPAFHPSRSIALQRKCACGGSQESEGECAECKAKREAALQRRAAHANAFPAATTAPPIVHAVLSSPGQPLDAGTRAFMEPPFGHDFSQVRVHTDAKAAESARAVNALAYTVGRDMVFETGQYAPLTGEGKRLLAHELTHVLQQSNVALQSKLHIGEPGDEYEQEADRISDSVMKGGVAQVQPDALTSPIGPSIQRTMICSKRLEAPGIGLLATIRILTTPGAMIVWDLVSLATMPSPI